MSLSFAYSHRFLCTELNNYLEPQIQDASLRRSRNINLPYTAELFKKKAGNFKKVGRD
jgi:hypothetical protein